MKKDKKYAKGQNDSNRLELDDIYNSDDPEVRQFVATAMKEEMSKASAKAFNRVAARVAWRFKDKLSPHMQRVLEQHYPNPDAA